METSIAENNDRNANQAEQKNLTTGNVRNRKIRIVCFCMLFVISLGIVGVLGINEYQRLSQYNLAVEKCKVGSYAEAKELFLSIDDYRDSAAYITECTYQMAIVDFERGAYEEAVKVLSQIGDYKHSSKYLTECLYQIAIVNLEKGEYDKAIEMFSNLEEYKDSSEYRKKAVLERKYERFNLHIDIEPKYFELTGLMTVEEVEDALSNWMYDQWYDIEANENIVVCAEHINNRPYGINYVTCTGSTYVVNFYFLDNPEETIKMVNTYVWFEYIDVYISTLEFSSAKPDGKKTHTLYAVPAEEYNSFLQKDTQVAAQQPRYTNDQIIQKAFSLFQNKIGGYYSGAGKLYHSSGYSDANVSYDWQSKTYTCTFLGSYCTNIFDVWGTSTNVYYVIVKYSDTGADLALCGFSIT